MKETGWLIESSQIDGTPHWFSLSDFLNDGVGWTTDSVQALRFARKIDAENYIAEVGWNIVTPTEHSWG